MPPAGSVWTLELLPYVEPLLTRSQQPDNLCGPYWIALLLQAFAGISVSAVEVAIAASTQLPDRGGPWVPPGARSVQGDAYGTIPTISALDQCGTSVMGLMAATEQISQGRFCLLPLRTDDWEASTARLWSMCQAYPEWQVMPLLNCHTAYLWGAHLSPADLFSYLQTGNLSAPPADWSVGHFALLVGQMVGKAASLYAVLDTYVQFGWAGLHLQPGAAIAQSLDRPNHPTQGGLALFLASSLRPQVEQKAIAMGFSAATWDNGTPAPALRL
ncbi:MAG: hypothetical protein AAF766_24760 [Cyanobacteria bacterium P01_D01_bin.14]